MQDWGWVDFIKMLVALMYISRALFAIIFPSSDIEITLL
jgi:hypothetical protein